MRLVRVKSVKLLRDFIVSVNFTDGTEREINLEPFLRGKIFENIRENPTDFQAMKVDERMGTIVWENGADIDPDVLYYGLKPAWAEETELELTIAESSTTIRYDKLPVLEVNPTQIKQLLVNLLGNAIKFRNLDKECLIDIQSEKLNRQMKQQLGLNVNKSFYRISISDNGIGFEEGPMSTKKTLGLLGMKERSMMMGGVYNITSAKGAGTTVTVIIPLSKKAV